MSNNEMQNRFKRAIDQFFNFPNRDYIENRKVPFIGGLLQAALHLLPWEEYYSLKVYCYEKHGYDPGGVASGQTSIYEYEGEMMEYKEKDG